ncbi:hypothetical protein BVY04_03055 [bacterium M21]|nr:hypothetical protein BVY04_03055 [bacterium M21]
MKTILTKTRVAIVGLGQLGASLGLRLKELGAKSVFGIDLDAAVIQQAVDAGAIDYGNTDAGEILPAVDMTVICTPLAAAIPFIQENLEEFRFGSIVTDVGSVKGAIIDAVREPLLAKGIYFIGSHPMVGSEQSGIDSASSDLYADRICFVTPTEDDDDEALQLVHDFWRPVGCCVIDLDVERHDRACAETSHLLHLTAAAAVNSVLGQGDVEAKLFACAGGFRDHTRIAAGDPGLWTEVCKQNAPAVLAAIQAHESELAKFRKAVELEDWTSISAMLGTAAESRAKWYSDYSHDGGRNICRDDKEFNREPNEEGES